MGCAPEGSPPPSPKGPGSDTGNITNIGFIKKEEGTFKIAKTLGVIFGVDKTL